MAFGTPVDETNGFIDADRAVEEAERRLLAQSAQADWRDTCTTLHQCSLLRGVDAAGVSRVASVLQTLRLGPGEHLFRERDAGDGLYLVLRGSISVLSGDGRQRYVSFSSGTMLGEIALLDGRGRSADAVADGPSEVARLPSSALADLASSEPLLAAQLYRNIATNLAERLRHASMDWHVAAQ